MKKVAMFLTPLLVLSLLLGAVGCGGDEATPKPTAAPTAAPTATVPTMEPVTWKLIHGYPETSLRGEIATKFEELMEEYTDGKIMVDVYHAGTLFSLSRSWEATVTGAVDVDLGVPYYAAQAVPWFTVFYMLGMWEGYDHMWNLITSDAFNAKMLADLEPNNVHPLGAVANATLHGMATKVEVKTWRDLEGLKVPHRAGAPIIPDEIVKGYVIVEVTPGEELIAFQTGLVDVNNPAVETLVAMECWEWADYIYIEGGMADISIVNVNKDSWDAIPAYYQDIITDEVFPEVQLFSFNRMKEKDATGVALLKENMNVNEATAADLAEKWAAMLELVETQGALTMFGAEVIQIVDDARP
ncbi:TRAP transporter substrate-binding protein [Chloroflexota bacterium]